MLEKLEEKQQRYDELERLLASPEIISDQNKYQQLAKEYSEIAPVVKTLKDYQDSLKQSEELKNLLTEKHDEEFESLAQSELQDLEKKQKYSER